MLTFSSVYPGRALRNEFFDRWHGREDALQGQRKEAEAAYLAADDDLKRRVVWAGESVDLVRDIPFARDVIERIVEQAASVLREGATLVRD